MNFIRFLTTATLLVSAAACRSTGVPAGAAASPQMHGSLPATQSLSLQAGASVVRLVVGETRDSVRWTLRTSPAACASVRAEPGTLRIARNNDRCRASWEISVPGIADVDVQASVGDIDLVVYDKRAVRLATSVGRVAMRIDGHAIEAPRAAGSGDRLSFGDLNAAPRVTARTGVGSISAHLRTTGENAER